MKMKIDFKVWGLGFVVIVGMYLRLRQWSDYLIYPDSYHYLVTHNQILTCGKPLYCAITNVISVLFDNPQFILRILSLFCSVLSIIIIYKIFNKTSKFTGLILAFLLALSFVEVCWTSHVLPDQLGLMLFLFFLLYRNNTAALVLLFAASLVRPEYLLVLVISTVFLPFSRKAKILSLSFFITGVIFYVFTNETPEAIFALKKVNPLVLEVLFKYEILIIYGAIAGLIIRLKNLNKIDYLMLAIFGVFLIIYFWVNPSNWRYITNLLVPLLYFNQYFYQLLLHLNYSRPIFKVGLVVLAIALIYQVNLATIGVKEAIPSANYESILAQRSVQIAKYMGLDIGRFATYYDKAIILEMGESAVNPLNEDVRSGDLLIYDDALRRAGYRMEDKYQLREVASFQINTYYFLGQKKLFPEKTILFLVAGFTRE